MQPAPLPSNRSSPRRALDVLVINWQDRLHPRAGGAELHLHEVFGRLAGRGHTVTALVCGWPGAPRREVVDGIDVHRVGNRHTFGIAAPLYYRRVLRTRPFDVVIEDLNKLPLAAPWWAGRPVVLLVHHLFGRSAFRAASPGVAAATWIAERLLHVVYRDTPVQAVSHGTAYDLELRGLAADRIRVIHNGVDTARLVPGSAAARSHTPTFLYVGRLQPYKRVDLVIRAVARLTALGVDVRLVIAGRGPHEGALRELVARLGLASRVTLAGWVSDDEKRRLLQQAWANVLTSDKEGWGLSVLEAAACGTPTIASDSPGLRESVVHERTGLLVPHGDVIALADAMRQLAEHPQRVRELGRAARARAERFTWESAAMETERHLLALRETHESPAAGAAWDRRPVEAPVTLPRNGPPELPFGCSGFIGYVSTGTHWSVVRALVGALDASGRAPAYTLRRLTWRNAPRTPLEPGDVAVEQHATPLEAGDGWPRDPVAFVAMRLRELYGPDADVRVAAALGMGPD